jgi:hypothetical protein
VSLNGVDDPLDGGRLLTDCNIDTNYIATLLIDNAINGYRSLSDCAVPDDQLSLPAPERKHGIKNKQASLDGFTDEIPVDNRRRRTLDWFGAFRSDYASTVEWAAQRINYTAQQGPPDRHAYNLASAADGVSRFDSFSLIEEDTP